MGIIYKATNKINGKSYIGQTIRSLNVRKREHLNKNRNFKTVFQNALYKYGMNNFEWKILFESNNIDILNKKETYFIEKYNTLNNGYNLTTGGLNGKYSLESRKKMSDFAKTRTGEKNPFYGKTHSEETKKTLSEISSKQIPWNKGKKTGPLSEETKKKIGNSVKGKKNGFYGKKHSKEIKEKLRKSRLGKNILKKPDKKCEKPI